VYRIEGETDPQIVIPRLHQGVADNEAFLVVARQDRLERSMTQTLRQQQDEAYLESLKADQEKEKRKQEDLEKQRQAEEDRQREIDEKIQRIEVSKYFNEFNRFSTNLQDRTEWSLWLLGIGLVRFLFTFNY